MNRTLPLEQFEGRTPSPVAIYRPAGIFGSELALPAMLATMLGIAHLVLDFESLRGLDAHREALEDLKTRVIEIGNEANGKAPSTELKAELEANIADQDRLVGMIAEMEIVESAVKAATKAQDGRVEGPVTGYSPISIVKKVDNLHDVAAVWQQAGDPRRAAGIFRDRAMAIVDKLTFPTVKDQDAAREQVAKLLTRHKDDANGIVARRVMATEDPTYREAWAEYISRGKESLSPRHLAVLQTGSDPDGGFGTPISIDPTFQITTSGAASSLREFARVETITTKSWHPLVTEDGDASYGTETSASTDTAPDDIDDVNGVTPVRAKRFIKFTAEFQEDYGPAAIVAQVGVLIRDSKSRLEAQKFVLGTGSGEPEGIIWKLDDDGTSLVSVANFDLDGLDDVTAALGPRFRDPDSARTAYMANLAILQKTRQLGTAGAPANSIYDQISRILNGYPARELSYMDDVWTSGKEVLLFGDFLKFVIVDRIGLATQFVPQVFDGSGDPLGQSGIYARWRNTSKVLTVNAFRLLTHS